MSKISIKGNSFVTAEGNKIVFRGLDTSDPDKLEKDWKWDIGYFQEMKNWGATLTGFPVHPQAWRERGKKTLNDYLKNSLFKNNFPNKGYSKSLGFKVE